MPDALTGPWVDDDDAFDFRTVARNRQQLEADAIIDKLKRANRSLNNFLDAWGKRKIGQGHDLYVYHIPAAAMIPVARALFLHIYLDILHTAVLLGDSKPVLKIRAADETLFTLILKELEHHQLILFTKANHQFYVKDFMVGGALMMVDIEYLK